MADPVGILINIALQAAIRLAIAALTPKEDREGPRLEDTKLTTSTYGQPIPIGYGTVLFSGNVIWGKDIIEEKEKVQIGKGNPFSVGTQTIYTYFATFAVGICEREVKNLMRIYADGKLIYARDLLGTIVTRLSGLNFNFYEGTEDQLPDPIIEADVGDGMAPGYRGLCYIVFNELPLEDFGNRIPQFQFVVSFENTDGDLQALPLQGNQNTPDTLLIAQNESLVYDRERDILYVATQSPGTVAPYYLEAIDASTGENLWKIRSPGYVRSGSTNSIIKETWFVNGQPQYLTDTYMGSVSQNSYFHVIGGNSKCPYLAIIADDTDRLPAIAFYGKEDRKLIYVSKEAVWLKPGTWIQFNPDGSLAKIEDYYSGSAGGEMVDWGFFGRHAYVGFTNGGNGYEFDYINGGLDTSKGLRTYGWVTVAYSPSFRSFSKYIDNRVPAGRHISGTYARNSISRGTVGHCIGPKDGSYSASVFHLDRLQATSPSPVALCMTVLNDHGAGTANIDVSGGTWEPMAFTVFKDDGSGETENILAPSVDYNWVTDAQINHAMYWFDDIEVLVVGLPKRDGSGYLIRGIIFTTVGEEDVFTLLDPLSVYEEVDGNMRGAFGYVLWELTGYEIPHGGAQPFDSATKTSPDGTILVIKEGGPNLGWRYVLDAATGLVTATDFTSKNFLNVPSGSIVAQAPSSIWDGPNNRYLLSSPIAFSIGWRYFEPIAERGSETLQTVVEDICLRSKLTADDIDASALATKSVRGYPVQQAGISFRSALEPLATVYDFYGVEKDGKIVFEFRDSTVDKTIPEEDLLVQNDAGLVVEEIRGQDLEIPKSVYFTYMSAEDDWLDERNTQVARRITVPYRAVEAEGEARVEVPLTLTDTEAQEVVQRVLYDQWVAKESFKFRLPQRYVDLLPNDVLTLYTSDRVESVRIEKCAVSATLDVEVEARVMDGEVYGLNVQPVSALGSPNIGRKDTVIKSAKGRLPVGFAIDAPLLFNAPLEQFPTGTILFIAGEAFSGAGFNGASLLVTGSDGVTTARALSEASAPMGYLESDIPDVPGPESEYWNSVQEASIDVVVMNDSTAFSSVTQDDMITGNANSALLFDPVSNNVEVIGFRDVEAITIGENAGVRLTGLLRGKRGTDTLAKEWNSGDRPYLILLDPEWVTYYTVPESQLNAPVTTTVAAPGVNITGSTQNLTYQFRSLMPWAPVHARAYLDDPSTGNVTISWVRRTRVGGGWNDNTGTVPLGELFEQYEVDFMSGPGPTATVIRTVIVNNPYLVYTEDQAIEDYGSGFPNTIYCRIYQISGSVGRGFSHDWALTPE